MVQTTRRVVELAREDDALDGPESANAVSGETSIATRTTIAALGIIGSLPSHRRERPGVGLEAPSGWYTDAVRTTIDKAGRVVIPAAIRERSGLTPGTALEITVDEFGVRIERIAPGPRLVKVGRRLVARPTVPVDARPAVDIAALVEEERNRWP
jgi:AbrB family looped-hinge helix DNA binding protein